MLFPEEAYIPRNPCRLAKAAGPSVRRGGHKQKNASHDLSIVKRLGEDCDAKVRIIFGFPNFYPRKIAQEQFLGGISRGATGRRPSVGAPEERETRGKIWRQGALGLRHPFTRLGPPDHARPRPAAASPWRRDEEYPSRPTPHRQLPTGGPDGLDLCPLLLSPSAPRPSDPCSSYPYLLLP